MSLLSTILKSFTTQPPVAAPPAVTPPDVPQTREIYIGQWLSAATVGLGTKASPFNAKTVAQFDRLMRGLGPAPILILDSGLYQSTGSAGYNPNGFYLPPGIKIYGAGLRDTIVQCTFYPAAAGKNGHAVFESPLGQDGAGIEIADLAVDCNWQNLGAASATKIGAISLYGNNCTIRRCRHLNSYGNLASLAENFAFMIASHQLAGVPQGVINGVIEDSIGESFQGDYGVAMAVFGGAIANGATADMRGGRIAGNKVYDWRGTCALQVMGDGFVVADNEVTDSNVGIHLDTGKIDNVQIARNTFRGIRMRAVDVDLSLGAYGAQNLQVADNTCEMAMEDGISVVAINISAEADGRIANALVARNQVTALGSSNFGGNAFAGVGTNGLIVRDNTFSSKLTNTLTGNDALTGKERSNAPLTILNNFTELGSAPQNLENSETLKS